MDPRWFSMYEGECAVYDERLKDNLFAFINESYTPYHAAFLLEEMAQDAGFAEFYGGQSAAAHPDRVYHRDGGLFYAFRAGTKPMTETGIRLLLAHLDSPCLALKENGGSFDGMTRLSVEKYGGLNVKSFKDIPLRIAGRVFAGFSGNPEERRFVLGKKAVVPSLAVHLSKEDDQENLQENMQALWGLSDSSLRGSVAKELSMDAEDILAMEAYLVAADECTLLDPQTGLFMGPRLDDLAQVYVTMQSLLDRKPSEAASLVFFTNHEEIGSMSTQGAFSVLISSVLECLIAQSGHNRVEHQEILRRSHMVSLDMAHGYHPNYAPRYDKNTAPRLGMGPAIKISAQGKYATDTRQRARLAGLAKELGIDIQVYQNHSDIKGGTTLGPISSALTGVPAVDIGVPILGIHAAREVACLQDIETCSQWMIRYLEA